MIRKLFLLCFVLIIVACSKETLEEPNVNEPTPDSSTPVEPVNSDIDDEDSDTDTTTDNPLEKTTILIPDALAEMESWNSISLYTSYKEIFMSDSGYEYLQHLQYMRIPEVILSDVRYITGYFDSKKFYGERYGEDVTASYVSINEEAFEELEESSYVVRDHIKNRYDLLKFAYENKENSRAEIDEGNLVETFELSPAAYEEFASLLQYITSIEIVEGLDLKSNYEKVEISIVLSGLSIFGFAIEIEFTEDDIDGLVEIDVLESFESIDEITEIQDPKAG